MQRITRQREAIRGVLEESGRPMSPAEVLHAARRRVPTTSLATVYRNLRSLVDGGELARVELPGDAPRYEPRYVADRHHHHFRCRACDVVFDVEGCPRGLAALVPKGFRMDRHDIVLYGLCSECAE